MITTQTKLFAVLLFISNTIRLSAQEIPIPQNYSVVEKVKGDLDKDNIPELVVAYNTKQETDSDNDVTRELIIYKLKNKQWTVWKKSKQALYSSRGGGMMGDPFENIEIKNQVLSISQNGGSSWKWGHTDKYRFQNGAFFLIGYTSDSGKDCEYWTHVDFNLSTGKLIVNKEYHKCKDDNLDNLNVYKTENETFFKKGLKITLEKRSEKDVLIITPKYKHQIYIAHTND
ncbi:hypothetical protein NAT51_08275 [Flavobacterium amniphilum]|uniref:hypothetical protein n=1 Tax=Flavobacterium amniphilum TaxID=1834035 RepID=UPI00202A9FA5|nr:hypothetical protein [Flavobacterium amniphilum]MCL9805515.1 hypothetical protein [Flavobacterium amniphilum]